ncbi:flavodoxin reductase [Pacificitalea manganoxidans]|uniref:Flavodoxin reductase n=1 Tax=Pacificitalea manganoxidans TaxID=1411902 RepID=A0A291LWK4_9RHOB|nr:FAD-binding oxidoreductase [Pacificitalea manganoxidans]ATI41072.1 flavodoxin reductase [Pacificitalea manganoxidans]MAQ46192.1 flavodoxin reductase [Actibacterium sp.]MDR6308439.1 ferredoxin-NADP reductase [Pacificitalea manganoxidans]|tara:strand:- start:573 stop:1259 length:687 start_codon:yes stop_codon:yes gene_type:complete
MPPANVLTLQDIAPVTHDTWRLRFDRPEGYDFAPGQATHMALDRDGWREEDRPFTFTSLPEDEGLEFVIKSYPDHDGVTEQIPTLSPGDQVLAEPAAGAIEDKGAGVFIAGGAGITPFIAILRNRARQGTLDGCTLIFSNPCERDIILREELEQMRSAGLTTVFTTTQEDTGTLPHRRIDAAFLDEVVKDSDQPFYLCGPRGMVKEIKQVLLDRGTPEERITTEKGWG